ncbi:MAG: type 4 prepilin-like proteins leader peptide-processing enzyme [Gemmatimonadota bacterium]|nr:MAG: type 4 prepilin-like proteins leader peptide-processing enzyme [Gemmatimonadota bacterium]
MGEVWLVPGLAGLSGLAVGWFLNLCSTRWPLNQSIISPGSQCKECSRAIRWYDNIPVLSWLILSGKCRYCSVLIPIQYPVIELTSGLLCAAIFMIHGLSGEALRGSIFLCLLLGVSISDARFYIIPDEFSLGGTILGLGMSFLPGGIGWANAIGGALVGYIFLWFIAEAGTRIIEKISPGRLGEAGLDKAMGGGDIKMMMMVGSFVGISGVAQTAFLGSLGGLVIYGPIATLYRRLIPFGVSSPCWCYHISLG